MLSEYKDKMINKPFKNIDYNVATLDAEVLDIRNLRPKSDFYASEIAMTIRKAGLRKNIVFTRFTDYYRIK